jgi:hypothetical protein
MNWFERSAPLGTSSGALETEEDRRCNERNKFLKPIHIRHVDPPHSQREGTMMDLSRDGLYFTVRSPHYEVGMQLHLTLPHSGSEWTCEVVRTERLPNGGQGVGVRILDFGS